MLVATLPSHESQIRLKIGPTSANPPKEQISAAEFFLDTTNTVEGVKRLDITLSNGRWYRVKDVSSARVPVILEMLEQGRRDISCGQKSLESLLVDLRALLVEAGLKIIDVTASTSALLAQQKLLTFDFVPALVQERHASTLINLGCEQYVFENLALFEKALPKVLDKLLSKCSDGASQDLQKAVYLSLGGNGSAGLAPFESLTYDVAEVLLSKSFKFSAVVEVDLECLDTILTNIHKFTPEAQRSIHLFILLNMGEDQHNTTRLLELYATRLDQIPATFVLILDIFKTSKGRHASQIVAQNLNQFPRAEWDSIIDQLIAIGRASCVEHFSEAVLSEYGHEALAWKLLERNEPEMLCRNYLKTLSNLSDEVARQIVEGGSGWALLKHPNSFEPFSAETLRALVRAGHVVTLFKDSPSFRWEKDTYVKAVDELCQRSGIQGLLKNLARIPPKFLGFLEAKYHLIAYGKEIGLGSQLIYQRYMEKRNSASPLESAAFVRELKELVDCAISSKPFPAHLRTHPLYHAVLSAIYPNHRPGLHQFVGGPNIAHLLHHNHGVQIHDNALPPDEQNIDLAALDLTEDVRHFNRVGEDRTSDLSHYNIRPSYRIQLSQGVRMLLKAGCVLDNNLIRAAEAPTRLVQEELQRVHFDKMQTWEILELKLDRASALIPQGLRTKEERIYGLLLGALTGKGDDKHIKHLLLTYHFAVVEDIQAYFEGTRDVASQAKNSDYAHLLCLREFYADALRDTAVRIAKSAEKSETVQALLPHYHALLAQKHREASVRDLLNRSQARKLGATPKLLDQISKVLNDKTIPSSKKHQAVSGMIAGEQKKAATFLLSLHGRDVPPDDIHLGRFKLEEQLSSEQKEVSTQAKAEDLKLYLSGVLESAFRAELKLIDTELKKFKSEDGSRVAAMAIDGIITKNEPSKYARSVAGVCVASDTKQWNQKNYFQMVLQDPHSKRCEGVIMLHSLKDRGKKILVASFQPSSTYLHKVNEGQLFSGLLDQLILFAKENDFDVIACSANPGIRTNRTGGVFQAAMDKRIRQTAAAIELRFSQTFSFAPAYTLDRLDVLWRRKLSEQDR